MQNEGMEFPGNIFLNVLLAKWPPDEIFLTPKSAISEYICDIVYIIIVMMSIYTAPRNSGQGVLIIYNLPD